MELFHIDFLRGHLFEVFKQLLVGAEMVVSRADD